MNPHAPKAECDRLVSQNLLYEGCGKPFKFDGVTAVKCEYI